MITMLPISPIVGSFVFAIYLPVATGQAYFLRFISIAAGIIILASFVITRLIHKWF